MIRLTKKECAEIILDGVNCDAADCKDCKITQIRDEYQYIHGCDEVVCAVAAVLAEIVLKEEEDLVAQN